MSTDYSNGAITALSYLAERGVSKDDIQLVADVMNLNLEAIDGSDRERFLTAFGCDFLNVKLKPFLVGENDIVLAENEEKAVALLKEIALLSEHEKVEVEDLSTRLDMELTHENGGFLSTLGDYIADIKTPQHIVGWE